jgi:uncharacterized protein (TIGR02145 family)
MDGTLEITITNQTPVVPSKNLAPVGWHVPTDDDWTTLLTYLGGLVVAGGKMKEVGLSHWTTPNTGADNTSKFNGIPSGLRDETGLFISTGEWAMFWGTTYNNAWYGLYYDEVSFLYANPYPSAGGSVRPIKDSTTLINGQIGSVTDIDGNIYSTICIGTQEWFASNLNVTRFNDGTPIPNIVNNADWAALTTAGMCYYGNTAPGLSLSVYDMIWYNPEALTYKSTLVVFDGGGKFTISIIPSWVDLTVYNAGSSVAEVDGWYSGYEVRVTPNIAYSTPKTGVISINANSLTRRITTKMIPSV